ncbi:sigma-54 dependent transcriptional regulator [Sulfuriflexus sp.]|uniref:sigma-54-dependent transcriptional regulator n=1 Tax=Sulfuriflexus sp. TaxID=2015443 RepID=UPI0028CF8B7E|nr:sigma-54 dependent transcriptional regulator [Sulfuriflexus sp.]MDT8404345.1 sigma-54 dependent transcriptional regulator [Sulfuriflexus sp.]
MDKYLALIVDDEPDILELLEMTLSRMDIDCQSAADIATARGLLDRHDFDLCLTDMRLPDGDGIDLVRHMQQLHANVPVAMITAHGNMELAITALKAGAFDFVSKPVDLGALRKLVNTALKLSHKTHNKAPDRSANQPDAAAESATLQLLGDADIIQRTRETIKKLARSQAPVYISGESGSGKELVARLIHELGPRADRAFVPVNCGAIPQDLMESEFFGHKKGSFTGAVSDKTGLFQAADGGTLFLDEVAELPLHMQVKLLRAIQEKSVRPVGEQRETPVDVRILSATHKDLAALVSEGSFRQDLFYRINVIQLAVPSLRERSGDIPLLAGHILGKLAAEMGLATPRLTPEALDVLAGYPFPGNVRELENILERAMTLCEGEAIEVADLHLPAAHTPTAADESLLMADLDGEMPLTDYLDSIEKDAIQQALEQSRFNKTAAAKRLGITFRALRYRLKKLGLEE